MAEPALTVSDLRIETTGGREIVDGVGFAVAHGECLALVGESGCGKTSTALALLGHARAGTRVARGTVRVAGTHEMLSLSESRRRPLRGSVISYVPQDPTVALDPRQRVGAQVGEVLRVHGRSREAAVALTAEIVRRVGLPDDHSFLRRFPFELSGGQQQRLAIAMALVAGPAVVVLDEPTTGLDAATQARVLDLLRDLGRDREVAFVYVTHDLAVVDGLADRVAVMYAGRVVEEGGKEQVFSRPAHPYTALLLDSVPRLSFRRSLSGIPGTAPSPGRRPEACRFAPRCPLAIDVCREVEPAPITVRDGRSVMCHRAFDVTRVVDRVAVAPPALESDSALLRVEGLQASYGGRTRGGGEGFVLRDVWLTVGRGECVALVGESGSGKSTLGRCVVGLHRPDAGTISLGGEILAAHAAQRTRRQCQEVQFVFQNPDRSLNPARTVGDIVRRPLERLGGASPAARRAAAKEMLDRVRLPAGMLERYPRELSGGEKQRVAIARALAARPLLLICDEITSALDVSIQAAIVSLLSELRADGLALLFVTHNLALVNSIADGVVVLEGGHVREQGRAPAVLGSPQDEYTRMLLSAVPELRSDLPDDNPLTRA
jgi:peptide/nickel transport system ATP-binding protein